MKIRYEFITGETKEIEVDERFAKEVEELNRKEYNNFKREARRRLSIDQHFEEFGIEPIAESEEAIDTLLKEELSQAIDKKIIKILNTEQQNIVRSVFFYEKNLTEIARKNGVSVTAVHKMLKTCLKKLRANCQKTF